jgi:hypothetical protein
MDVPYESKRQGYKHLSITVQEDGQIQQLDEAEAGFRLASIAKALAPRDRGLPRAAPSGAPSAEPAKPKRSWFWSRKPTIAPPRHKRAGRRQPAIPAAAAATSQRLAPSRWRLWARILRWTWAIGIVVVLIVFAVYR